MKAVSSTVGVKVPADATVTADVGIGPRLEGGSGLDAALPVKLPGVDRADAEKLVAVAHQVCLYSIATPQQPRRQDHRRLIAELFKQKSGAGPLFVCTMVKRAGRR